MSRLNELREQIAAWAARHHPDALAEGVRAYLGDRRGDPVAEASAVSFALVAGTPSLIDRFAAQPTSRPRAERALLQSWARCRFSLVRVVDVAVDRWIDVHDVLARRTVRIVERAGSRQARPDTWMAAFYFDADEGWQLEGTILTVPAQARSEAVHAALDAYRALGVEAAAATPAQSRAVALATVRAIHAASRPPRFVNADGHDLVPVTSTLDLPWSEVLSVAARWPDAFLDDGCVNVLGPEPVAYQSGWATRGTFRAHEGKVDLSANSRERHDALLARFAAAAGSAPRVLSEKVDAVRSDPRGHRVVIDSVRIDGPDADVDALGKNFVASRDLAWCDTPLEALDGLSPREAVAAGRDAELWAMLPDGDRGRVMADALRMGVPPLG